MNVGVFTLETLRVLGHRPDVGVAVAHSYTRGNSLQENSSQQARLVHLHVEDCSEELLRQQSFAIKNQLGHPGAIEWCWFFMA